jgi:hypothetical protein
VTEKVRDFLAEYVDGFQELELLVALVERGGPAALDELARQSHGSNAELASAAGRLRAAGVLVAGEARDPLRIALDDPRLGELAELYRRDPVVVLRLLNALAIERVRVGATRVFADALLIRRRKPDG